MFLLFFLSRITVSASIPKFSHFVISDDCSSFQDFSSESKYDQFAKEKCTSLQLADNYYQECINDFKQMEEFQCISSSEELDEELEEIDNDVEILFITLDKNFEQVIDLNLLPRQMKVTIQDNIFSRSSFKNLSSYDPLQLIGGVSEKVSYLTISLTRELKIVKSNLNVHSVYFQQVTFSTGSKSIKAKNVICAKDGKPDACDSVFSYINKYDKNFVDTKQFGIHVLEHKNEETKVRVTFSKKNWEIESLSLVDGKSLPNSKASVSYDLADRLCVIGFNRLFELYNQDNEFEPINISVQNFFYNHDDILFGNAKQYGSLENDSNKKIIIRTLNRLNNAKSVDVDQYNVKKEYLSDDQNYGMKEKNTRNHIHRNVIRSLSSKSKDDWTDLDIIVEILKGFTLDLSDCQAKIKLGTVNDWNNPKSHQNTEDYEYDHNYKDDIDDNDDEDDQPIIPIIISVVVFVIIVVVIIVVVVLVCKKRRIGVENGPDTVSEATTNNQTPTTDKTNNNITNNDNDIKGDIVATQDTPIYPMQSPIQQQQIYQQYQLQSDLYNPPILPPQQYCQQYDNNLNYMQNPQYPPVYPVVDPVNPIQEPLPVYSVVDPVTDPANPIQEPLPVYPLQYPPPTPHQMGQYYHPDPV